MSSTPRGTPYYQRQPLRDVVFWYGLSQGIRDGILKDLAGSIQAYDFSGDAGNDVAHVVRDFFQSYGDVRLPNGAPARLAIYFPQTDDLKELRPLVDRALVEAGQTPDLVLVNTSDTTLTKQADIDAFNRLNDPAAPHRVMLLVNKGTEGWNCPSLFACALARRLRTSNNFVLQAATRCLRQVPGNTARARVYLSADNFGILDRQLQETYGESVRDLNRTGQETGRCKLRLRKLDLPPLVVSQVVRTVVRKECAAGELRLGLPGTGQDGDLKRRLYTVAEQHAGYSVLQQVGATVAVATAPDTIGCYAAAVELSSLYRVDLWRVYDEIRRLYGGQDVPLPHLSGLAEQIEAQTRSYEVREERVEVALALVKPEGFLKETDAEGAEFYTAEIVYPRDREHLLLQYEAMASQNSRGFGFHYTPYNFDSMPEMSFFEQMLAQMNLGPEDVEDLYYTGGLTDPGKTDFFVEYKDDQGRWRRYTPDFVIRRKARAGENPGGGRVLIVEIKREHERDHPVDGEKGRKAMALRKWEDLNPDRLKYEMVFTPAPTVTGDQAAAATKFLQEGVE